VIIARCRRAAQRSVSPAPGSGDDAAENSRGAGRYQYSAGRNKSSSALPAAPNKRDVFDLCRDDGLSPGSIEHILTKKQKMIKRALQVTQGLAKAAMALKRAGAAVCALMGAPRWALMGRSLRA
jgi:hypothetical protein